VQAGVFRGVGRQRAGGDVPAKKTFSAIFGGRKSGAKFWREAPRFSVKFPPNLLPRFQRRSSRQMKIFLRCRFTFTTQTMTEKSSRCL
jgi:hypothetical protein